MDLYQGKQMKAPVKNLFKCSCVRATGASSGLHHDFHDNLYVLLRGCKRFQLFPAALAPRMHARGRIRNIHPNGRIVYEGRVGGRLAVPEGGGLSDGGVLSFDLDLNGLRPVGLMKSGSCFTCVAFVLMEGPAVKLGPGCQTLLQSLVCHPATLICRPWLYLCIWGMLLARGLEAARVLQWQL
jgi:hypothetical protein